MAAEVERWQIAISDLNLDKGDRVAIHIPNGVHWVACDQACLRLGLVVVPLYVDDRPDNASYVLEHSGGDGALPVVDVLSSQHEHGSGSPFDRVRVLATFQSGHLRTIHT